VLDDKWQATVVNCVAAEAEALTLALVRRIQQLGDRYSETVGVLEASLREIEAKVASYLTSMGVR
jgi:type I restriction enzyme M protein